MKQIQVTKVMIQIGTTEVGITVEQARKLKEALEQLLGASAVPMPVVVPYPVPMYPPTIPFWHITWYDDTTSKTGVPGNATVSYMVE